MFFTLPGLRHVKAIALWPFILIKDKSGKRDKVLIQHEGIHIRQQIELLVLPFYLIYLMEFLWHLLRGRSWHLAYRSISFEREAYRYETEENYLDNRPLFASFRMAKGGKENQKNIR
jgi:hypothetical protein